VATFQGAVDTASNWSASNRVPLLDEYCFESDTGKLKIGDGVTSYNSLAYINPGLVVAGAIMVAGSGTPDTSDGVDGDYYYDVASSHVWGPKAGGIWPTSPVSRIPQQLTVGESVIDRRYGGITGISLTSGTIRFTYFQAEKTETCTQIRSITDGTAAAATPTLAKMGVYSVNTSTGDLTLLSASANDTALWNATSSPFTKSLGGGTGFAKVAGTWYACADLIITGTTAPNLAGTQHQVGSVMASAPRWTSALTGQTDLPSSVTSASLTASAGYVYHELLP
jgi:hypothetical protein